ncbi:hypothetical protein [Rickettsiales endosymbiont of Peranema trichophorum]|uniref:hypothetical protein n=1 Tax=Rickettsiales endosymbiont of Peranema trichophorum TaxID=2486577 RepID=UPI001F5D0CED|nr:hypothetical protein [Rickettsiales endosymbiont of Peranema trichophorum]
MKASVLTFLVIKVKKKEANNNSIDEVTKSNWSFEMLFIFVVRKLLFDKKR